MINFIGTEAQVGHTYQKSTQDKTGTNSLNILKNIYDLEGNNLEWTAQAYGISNRVHRGGYYNSVFSYSKYYSASYRDNYYPNDTLSGFTSRSTLTIAL